MRGAARLARRRLALRPRRELRGDEPLGGVALEVADELPLERRARAHERQQQQVGKGGEEPREAAPRLRAEAGVPVGALDDRVEERAAPLARQQRLHGRLRQEVLARVADRQLDRRLAQRRHQQLVDLEAAQPVLEPAERREAARHAQLQPRARRLELVRSERVVHDDLRRAELDRGGQLDAVVQARGRQPLEGADDAPREHLEAELGEQVDQVVARRGEAHRAATVDRAEQLREQRKRDELAALEAIDAQQAVEDRADHKRPLGPSREAEGGVALRVGVHRVGLLALQKQRGDVWVLEGDGEQQRRVAELVHLTQLRKPLGPVELREPLAQLGHCLLRWHAANQRKNCGERQAELLAKLSARR